MAIAVNLGVGGNFISGRAIRFATWGMHISAMIMMILTTILIRFSASYYSPLLNFCVMLLDYKVWQGAMQFFTEPVLFLLVNLVIVCIWVSSSVACTAVEENLQSMSIAPKTKSQRDSSAYKQRVTTASFCSSSPQADNSHSKILSPCATFPSSKVYAEVERSQIECSVSSFQAESTKEPSGSISEGTTASFREQKRSYSVKTNPTRRQDHSTDRKNDTSKKITPQNNWETKKYAASSLNSGAAVTRRTKFENRCASFPQLPACVIVKDMAIGEADSDKSGMRGCRPEVLVIEKDELNERIEAFFAKFREQLKKESLRSQ
ncbi:hypothetical protein O6H91_02G026600 [Diphasiastrum complanatum]|uniref:Uncharacterized protein n=1 Tax=Diphasiastrum complanatum TaxID=34168 RepID=A0ACC2EDN9_DIPCM|nr:hypothetical protein O6H91_Y546100 [Diphasiastrum complanatum]KAJ7564624.1 hypothetical protein O6H91_02G026600 [Diphasiastrum complanatum]